MTKTTDTELRASFLAWSGGFDPTEVPTTGEDSIASFVKYARPSDLSPLEVRIALAAWGREHDPDFEF